MNYLADGEMITNGCASMDIDVYIKTQRLDTAMMCKHFKLEAKQSLETTLMTLHIHSTLLLRVRKDVLSKNEGYFIPISKVRAIVSYNNNQ